MKRMGYNTILRAAPLMLVAACSSNGSLPDGAVDNDVVVQDATSDAGTDAASLGTPTFVVHFDRSSGQLPEGLWQITASGQTSTLVGFAPLASVQTVRDTGAQALATIAPNAANTFTLGITTDANQNVYVAVAAAAANPVPAPGIYRIAAGGSTATVFSAGAAATPAMNFPNGLDFIGNDLFVTDSEGVIYKVDSSGVATVWSQDPLFTANQMACGGVVPLAVGVNGLTHDANNLYVTNTDYGRVMRIPIRADGTAGPVAVIHEDCAMLAGADGMVLDTDGSLIVAVNAQNRIVRVQPSGETTVLAAGAPLDTPASVLFDRGGTGRRLLITNASFFAAPDAGAPGLLALPLP